MPKRQLINESFGLVRLRELERDRVFRVQYRDPETGKYTRPNLKTTSFVEARRMALELNTELLEGRGGIQKAEKPVTIKEAMMESLRGSRANARTKENYRYAANMFLTWVAERYPGLTFWRELRPVHLQQYVQHLERTGKSTPTIRLYLHQVKATATHMVLNHFDEGYQDVGAPVVLPRRHEGQEPVALDAEGVSALLSHLELHDPELLPMVGLQALCGLRIREVLALRECDVEIGRRTIAVADTPAHRPKTISSNRVLPIPRYLNSLLRDHIQGMRLRHAEEYLFLRSDAQLWKDGAYSYRLKRAMNACAREGGPSVLVDFAPRRLRATFATIARTLGADVRVLARFLGHSAKDVIGQHYLAIDVDDLRQVPALFDGDWVADFGLKKSRHCTPVALAGD